SAPAIQITNYVIVLLLMSVPVAFPTMFAVAQTYGALQLNSDGSNPADKGKKVLTRRLGAVQEAAVMDVLCSDKTGTLTMDRMAVSSMTVYGGIDEKRLLAFASAATNAADQDSIDQAILDKAIKEEVVMPDRLSFTPFDPSTKRTAAEIAEGSERISIDMGLPGLLLTDDVRYADLGIRDVADMSAKGLRVLAVVVRDRSGKWCAGLIGMSDPIRPDAPALIRELSDLGVRVVMITGDGKVTAGAVARSLGLVGDVLTPADLKRDPSIATTGAVFAEAYPEDKLAIIEALQNAGHSVGMTGDGVNDAPALHKAEVGIAVLGSTEVAKQAASFILTSAGLEGVRRVVTAGRRVYMRIHTWILNKIIKSVESLFIATVIFVMTHSYILSPLIAILILLSNDFVTISLAADHTRPMSKPAKWNIPRLVIGSFLIAIVPYVFTMWLYLLASREGYQFDTIRTVMYVSLIYLGEATLLAIRAWPYSWSVRPKGILVVALAFSLAFSSLVAGFGIFIQPLPASIFPLIIGSAIASFFLIEAVKRIPFVQRFVGV
ncbi:MAG: HAD-IC family P-type ATPase, partial [Patescibacteria group bacterium]|nr:HAD-IC family P-type ATPase [Patescibacteria group bacterium]